MRMPRHLLLGVTCLLAQSASAGIYTDDLAKCLVESTTASDRTDLVVWIFAAASAHPSVAPLTDVSPEQIDKASEKAAALLKRLLTESCLETAKRAVQYEGPTAFQASMQVLGQVAGKELFSSPEVGATLSGLDRYFDSAAIQKALEEEPVGSND